MVFMFVAWNLAFTVFHNIFFDSGTWTFFYTDSLIRLFPEQFWFDFGIIWTGSILARWGSDGDRRLHIEQSLVLSQ